MIENHHSDLKLNLKLSKNPANGKTLTKKQEVLDNKGQLKDLIKFVLLLATMNDNYH